ncbi:MAG: glutathione S-transferase, partial [Gammaproteobacteria bacterium]|nr:glutathione S-transferase [Gammaproteobacteria bacterium]NNM21007.1 glutathione S-transferase [Gammaproteobacteria bacterium]
MAVPITALYAGLLAILLTIISAIAGIMRGRKKISVGDGGDMELLVAMRRHANAVEYVPLALILIGILELNGANSTFLHVLGAVLVISRIAHAYGLKPDGIGDPFRGIGAGGTALMIVVAAGYAIWTAVGTM